jgi:hypothetical protein
MWKRVVIAGVAAGLVAVASPSARADWCETFPGSQQYTDQGCDKPYDDRGAGRQSDAPPPKYKQAGSLREQLQRALAERPATTNKKASSAALANAVTNARQEVQRALGAAVASDPGQIDQARRDYNAALAKLDRAYDAAAAAASPQGAEDLREMKRNDDAAFAAAADRLGMMAPPPPPPAPPAQAPPPSLPPNITAVKGLVYVCDGPIAGANNVSCREISADGRQCRAVTLADGGMGWRDSIATPCRADDLAQRQAFLAANPEILATVNGTTETFGMDHAETEAEIARLNASLAEPADGAMASMSAACREILGRYIVAAQANDGPAAAAEYAALKQEGGCGVLQQVEPQEAVPDARFVSRGDTPMLDQTFGACDRQAALCNEVANQLKAGTSPEAVTAMYSHAIGVGLELGAMMGSAVLNAQAHALARTAATRGPTVRARAPGTSYPRAISCSYSGCRTTNGGGSSNIQSDITGLGGGR